MAAPVVIATWPFGMTAVGTALPLLEADKSALDAALAGAQAVEDDPHVNSVGYGGLANALGVVQLDACVMDGRTLACGAVAAVENVRHVAALARRVMEKTPHLLLAGEGARQFALEQGFPLASLHTSASVAGWEKTSSTAESPRSTHHQNCAVKRGKLLPEDSHDTVTVLALDSAGSLAGVCSTSGLAHKLSGRVGDSPIIGAGLYVDDLAGAAGGTGVGEEILRISGSSLIVEAMRNGKSPQKACELAIQRINAVALRRGVAPARVAFIALDRRGRFGAAATEGGDFQFAIGRAGGSELRKAKEVLPDSTT